MSTNIQTCINNPKTQGAIVCCCGAYLLYTLQIPPFYTFPWKVPVTIWTSSLRLTLVIFGLSQTVSSRSKPSQTIPNHFEPLQIVSKHFKQFQTTSNRAKLLSNGYIWIQKAGAKVNMDGAKVSRSQGKHWFLFLGEGSPVHVCIYLSIVACGCCLPGSSAFFKLAATLAHTVCLQKWHFPASSALVMRSTSMCTSRWLQEFTNAAEAVTMPRQVSFSGWKKLMMHGLHTTVLLKVRLGTKAL